jgi:hypothetical protein
MSPSLPALSTVISLVIFSLVSPIVGTAATGTRLGCLVGDNEGRRRRLSGE